MKKTLFINGLVICSQTLAHLLVDRKGKYLAFLLFMYGSKT